MGCIYHFKIVDDGPDIRYMLIQEDLNHQRIRLEGFEYKFNTRIVQDIRIQRKNTSLNRELEIIAQFRAYVKEWEFR